MVRAKFFFGLFLLVATAIAAAQNNLDQKSTIGSDANQSIGAAKVTIAKDLVNPIANLVSVPLQFNFIRGAGFDQAGRAQTLVIQPTIPFNIGDGDLFVIRPLVAGLRDASLDKFTGAGIYSVSLETYYAPYTGSSWIWGVGPYAIAPSGNSGRFGSQQTGAGVTGVVLNRHGPWSYGVLAYQSWSVGGNPAFGTQNTLYGQPFVTYTNSNALTISMEAEAQYNYDIHRTNNPLYFGISKVVVIDGQPVSFGAGPTYYLSNVPGGPSGWGARAQISFAFPRNLLPIFD